VADPKIPSGQAVLFFFAFWTASKLMLSAAFAAATTDMKVFA
jgi:hypothetical protein